MPWPSQWVQSCLVSLLITVIFLDCIVISWSPCILALQGWLVYNEMLEDSADREDKMCMHSFRVIEKLPDAVVLQCLRCGIKAMARRLP